jgi:hypothetical protein
MVATAAADRRHPSLRQDFPPGLSGWVPDRTPLRFDTREAGMRLEGFTFGSICIDDVTYRHDVVIDRGKIRKRSKKPSKPFRDTFGHTPLSVKEKIPWKRAPRPMLGRIVGSIDQLRGTAGPKPGAHRVCGPRGGQLPRLTRRRHHPRALRVRRPLEPTPVTSGTRRSARHDP